LVSDIARNQAVHPSASTKADAPTLGCVCVWVSVNSLVTVSPRRVAVRKLRAPPRSNELGHRAYFCLAMAFRRGRTYTRSHRNRSFAIAPATLDSTMFIA